MSCHFCGVVDEAEGLSANPWHRCRRARYFTPSWNRLANRDRAEMMISAAPESVGFKEIGRSCLWSSFLPPSWLQSVFGIVNSFRSAVLLQASRIFSITFFPSFYSVLQVICCAFSPRQLCCGAVFFFFGPGAAPVIIAPFAFRYFHRKCLVIRKCWVSFRT